MEIVKKYELELEGMEGSPLCFNVMKRELEEEIQKLEKNRREEWEEKNWRRKAEFKEDKNGKETDDVLTPERWIHSVLINACMKSRMKPYFAKSQNATYTLYVGSFTIENIGGILCKKKDLEYFGCYEPSRGKSGGGKVWRIRPIIRKWKGKFRIIDPEGRMKKEELKELFRYAGLYLGIGDGRTKKFGRFDVTHLNEVK